VHLVDEVVAGSEIPVLQDGGVASSLQLHRDPLRPGAVDRGVADEEVPLWTGLHRTFPALNWLPSLIGTLAPFQ
jgi:hypothetical protein